MKICYRLVFSVLGLVSAFAQSSQVPYMAGGGPTFAVHTDVRNYPGSYRSIREVDFRNLNNGRASLRSGRYERNEQFDHYSEVLDSVDYLQSQSHAGESFALVVYSWFEAAGSSSSGGYAVLYTLSKGRLQSLQSIDWETHSAGTQPTWSFNPKRSTLVIRSDHYMPGDAHCCISATDVVTFQWDGKQFHMTGIRPSFPKPEGARARRFPD